MRLHFITALFFLAHGLSLYAQDTLVVYRDDTPEQPPEILSKYYPKSRMTGLNVTPLMTQLIPFNRSDPKAVGPFQMRFKNYKRGKSAFRFAMGASLSDFDDNPFLHLQMGWEWRKNITERWSYTRGIDAVFTSGALNIPGDQPNDFESTNIGFGMPWGIEYAIAPRITLSTETELLMLGGDDGVIIRIIPPVGLFLNYYFSKK